MRSDGELLRQFSQNHDEACFAELVQRHLGFVYAVSCRRLRDSHTAQDATQAVFVALARKAARVAAAPSVMGWLHRSACYETRNLMRAQAHRLARETEAHLLGTAAAESRPHLPGLEAVIDEALCELPETDRTAILARYFSQQSYAELGAALRLTENAARMRVERALARLRVRLERRGITSTAAALALALPACAAQAVPGGLAASVTHAAVLGASAAAGPAVLFGFMSTAKIITGAAALAVLGGIAFQYHRTTQLTAALAAARAENTASLRRIDALQHDVADLKRIARAVASVPSSPAAPAANAAAPTSPAPAAPIPGVTPKAPKGWFKNGSAPEAYEVGVDANNAWGGMPSAYAKSTGTAAGKFGGMMQTISTDAYKGQRVRLTGWMKTEDANDDGGHLWMRVDGQGTSQLQFDNMNGRAPKGTTDWQEYSIVLDVPAESTRLNYGFFVGGQGKMWVNGLTISPVAADVPTTDMMKGQPALPKTPVNLGFTPPASP